MASRRMQKDARRQTAQARAERKDRFYDSIAHLPTPVAYLSMVQSPAGREGCNLCQGQGAAGGFGGAATSTWRPCKCLRVLRGPLQHKPSPRWPDGTTARLAAEGGQARAAKGAA